MKSAYLVVCIGLVLAGCATMSKSNTRRSTYVWRGAVEDGKRGNKVYCPEPVGPATKLNETAITVKGKGAVEGSLTNAQSLGKIYDLGDIIQFTQYATFMNCVAWANGAYSAVEYNNVSSDLMQKTKDLIETRITAEAKATVEAKAEEVKKAAAATEQAQAALNAETAKAAAAPAGAAADQRMVEQAKAALKRAQAEQKAVEDFAAKQQ